MKLLIVTQAVDTEDTTLGFFVRWIEEFAAHAEHLEVICLREGKHASLPANVRVHSLGKEESLQSTPRFAPRFARRLRYAIRFKRLAWQLRHEYDAVFVHMNEEYVLIGGLLWKFLRKNIVLWRNHKMGSWRTRLAILFSNVVCHTSPQAFVAFSRKAVCMPVGIDTKLFVPPPSPPSKDSILFLGRLDPIKRPEIFLQALALLADKGISCIANLYGTPTDPEASHAHKLAEYAAPLVSRGLLKLSTGVPHSDTPKLYQTHAIYVNLTPSGSFDKTIGEAMASGCTVVAVNDAVRGVVPDGLMAGDSVASLAQALENALSLSDEERVVLGKKARAYILQEHSLPLLIRRLQAILGNKPSMQ